LHTVLPKNVLATLNQSPRLSKTNSVDDKSELNACSQMKRTKSNSVSSETGLTLDSDVEPKEKRPRLENITEASNESSPQPSETTPNTEN